MHISIEFLIQVVAGPNKFRLVLASPAMNHDRIQTFSCSGDSTNCILLILNNVPLLECFMELTLSNILVFPVST